MEKLKEIFGCPKNNSDLNKEWSLPKQREVEKNFYKVEYLHKVPELTRECCMLINSEWKRSLMARMRSIENSCENFPMSLILLENNKVVVGHCKISRLSMSKTKIFVESVVIHSALRGKGLGKFLMEAVEEVCKRKNIKWIYLATSGQEGFYEKLGYSKCPPVSMYGSQYDDEDEDENQTVLRNNQKTPAISKSANGSKSISSPSPPPPPPPPLPLPQLPNNLKTKTFMKKEIIF